MLSNQDRARRRRRVARRQVILVLLACSAIVTILPVPAHGRALATPVSLTDPIQLLSSYSYWNPSIRQSYVTAAELDNRKVSQVRGFHTTSYSAGGVITNGSCGNDKSGLPLPSTCSAVYQFESIAVAPAATITMVYYGSVYGDASMASARYQDAETTMTARNFSAKPCVFKQVTIASCSIWPITLTSKKHVILAYGYYAAFARDNGVGEMVMWIKPNVYGKGKGPKPSAAFRDLEGFIGISTADYDRETNNGASNMTDTPQVTIPFGDWPAVGAVYFQYLRRAGADRTSVNPMRHLHSKSYQSAGMITTGSCGSNALGQPNPMQCGGIHQFEIEPVSNKHTVAVSYVGTLYGTATHATGHFSDSSVASGYRCPFTVANKPIRHCAFIIRPVTNNSHHDIVVLYGAFSLSNALAEVRLVTSSADWKRAHVSVQNTFLNVMYGALVAVYTATRPANAVPGLHFKMQVRGEGDF